MTPPVEFAAIVLPCNHAVARPDGVHAVVKCVCGRTWDLTQDHGGKAWAATEIKP